MLDRWRNTHIMDKLTILAYLLIIPYLILIGAGEATLAFLMFGVPILILWFTVWVTYVLTDAPNYFEMRKNRRG